jgi:PAS domain S-box-containing protein
MHTLIHELHVHQIELEMQNDELRRTQTERDMAQARYFDFYDLAPVGYVTVSEQGLILNSNLTAAAMLGMARGRLAGQVFSRFIEREDQDTYYLLRKKLLETKPSQACELRMLKNDGSRFFARLDAIAAQDDAGAPGLRLVLIDITPHKQAEEELRIAAIAFEAQEAIVVMDSQRQILRANQAFTDITGYSKQDVLGQTTGILRSKQHAESSYDDIWSEALDTGSKRTERWLRHKNGEDFFAHGTITAVKDTRGQTTHYVITFSDQTLKQQQDQQRLQHEAAHREALVREVHHRIKNNLQGIGGLLRQFASQKPEIAEQMHLVTGHLNGISVIHGIQGRHDHSRVRLCELTREIAQATSVLWQTDITIDIPPHWIFRVVAEKEAVSVALVLNELLVNAVKHGGKAQGHVRVTLRQGLGSEGVELRILNAGFLRNNKDRPTGHHHGLALIESLRPREGLTVTLTQRGDQVHTLLQLTAPVIATDTKN